MAATHPASPSPAAGPSDLLGGRYRLVQPIARGGMATVWQALDERLGRPVAVKVLRDDLAGDLAAQERFDREAQVAAAMSSPYVVEVYDVGADGERGWMVMELIEGETLAERLGRDGAMDPAVAVAVADRMLAALEVAHQAGTVHRDVKPSNVLLPADGGVKLTDFGIAKSLGEELVSLTAAGQVLGTPRYLSPEQVAGQAACPATDVYAVGVVLYEALCGRTPFDGDDPLSVALARQRQDPERISDRCPAVPLPVAEVVHRALERDPATRYADATEMRRALRAATPTVGAPDGSSAGSVATGEGSVEDTAPAVPVLVGGSGGSDATVADSPVPDADDDPTVLAPAHAPPTAPAAEPRWSGRAHWALGVVAAALLVVVVVVGAGSGAPGDEDLLTALAAQADGPGQLPLDGAGTVAELEQVLRARPDLAGPGSGELADRLSSFALAPPPEQPALARALLGDVDRWEAEAQVAAEVAARVRDLIGPVAMAEGTAVDDAAAEEPAIEEPAPAPAPDEHPGQGRGRGR